MKTITNNFKDKIKIAGRELDSIITYSINNVEIELGNEQLNSITPHYEGNLFKSVMKQLDIDSNEDIPVGTEINFQFGIKITEEEVEDYRDNYEYINFGNYIVYSSEKQEDTGSYKIICYDKMVKSMIDYEYMNITYPITIRDYINAICNKLGLVFKNRNETFANYNRQIQSELYLSYNVDEQKWESLDYKFRDVLDELAQATASTICINENDELEVRYINETNDTINKEYLKNTNVNFGKMAGPYNTIILSRSAGSDKIYKTYPDDLPEKDRIAIEISDNQIMNWNDRSDYLPDILSRIANLTYSINDFSSTGICYYDLCDAYSIRIDDNDYYCVMLNDDINITQGLEENIHTEEMEISVTDYSKADKTDRRINQTYLIVDKQNQEIQSVVSQTSEQNQKISSLTQRVGSLESEITEIADMTISGETTLGRMELTDVIASVPITLKIRPVNVNIDKLYPNATLYPSTSLFPKVRAIRFNNTKTSEVFEYELPEGLLYYDSEHYDEFYLNGNDETCHITKRCKYNNDGSVGLLEEEEIHNLPFPRHELNLTDGDYIIELLGYGSAYVMVRLLGKNIYTDQFYTKVETNSKITQTAENIMSEVSSTYSTIDTANALSTRISQKASSIELVATDNNTSAGITIKLKNENGTQLDSKSANITMSGLVKFTDLSNSNNYTVINGGNITTGIIKSSNYVANSAGTSINLSNGVIDTKNFKVNSSGNITSTGGTIGGWTISNNALHTSSNNYYLGTSGITATIGGTSRSNIILKAGNNFGVNSSGTLYSRNAVLNDATVSGKITATSGAIGGISIDSQGLFYSGSSYTDGFGLWKNGVHAHNNSYIIFHAGGNSANIGGAAFKIYQNGKITASSADISGSISAGNNTYYLRMGSNWTKNPEVSGLNVGNYGISMSNNGVSNCHSISNSVGDLYLASNRGTIHIGHSVGGSSLPIEVYSNQVYINNYLDVTTSSFYVRKLNGTRLTLSAYINEASSKKLKENIKPIKNEFTDELYNEVKNLKIYSYDYKKEFREEDRLDKYGFMIDDIQDKSIAKLLDIESNNDYAMYSGKGLAKLDLILIKKLMNKIDELERKLNNE